MYINGILSNGKRVAANIDFLRLELGTTAQPDVEK